MKALVANQVDWASLFFPDIEKEWVAADPAHHQYWYPDTRPHRLPVRRHAPQAVRRSKSVRKALSMAHRSPADHEGSAQRLRAARGRGPALAESQKKWKDAALARDP